MTSVWWRRAAGIAMLAVMALVSAALLPPYLQNMKFQRALDDIAARGGNPEAVQAAVVDQAARMGVPVRANDVHVTREGNGVRVDIVYIVKVDIPLYTVDLHFHPMASSE